MDGSWHITDVQFGTMALLDNNAKPYERVWYTPYGQARHHWGQDFDGDRDFDSADTSALLNKISGGSVPITDTTHYDVEYDLNRDGTIDFNDLPSGSAQTAVPLGQLGRLDGINTGPDNWIGYAGYVWEGASSLYHVRFRSYSPELGRWMQRDPLGYVDGMGLYGYVSLNPNTALDPTGLRLHVRVGHGSDHSRYFVRDVQEALQTLLGDCAHVTVSNQRFGSYRTRPWKIVGWEPLGNFGRRPVYHRTTFVEAADLDFTWLGGPGCNAKMPCFNELDQMGRSSTSYRINYTSGDPSAEIRRGRSHGIGFHFDSYWNPTADLGVWTDPGPGQDLIWRDTPTSITLWHELMHNLHRRGDRDRDSQGRSLGHNQYQNPQIQLENIGRRCLGCPERYAGKNSHKIDSDRHTLARKKRNPLPLPNPGDTRPRP